MLLLTISLLCGIITTVFAAKIFEVIDRLNFEKRITERIDSARQIHHKGLTGNAIFLSKKLGDILIGTRSGRITRYLKRIETAFALLGEPFNTITPSTFLGMQMLAGGAFAVCMALLFGTPDVLLLIISFASGFILPYYYIHLRVTDKHRSIFRQIPDILDLLSLMTEAGLDFNASMRKIIDSDQGPLIRELALTQREIQLGKSRSDAYANMAKRVDFQPLTNVINSFLISFSTGTSLAPTLKTLSEQFRTERTQHAEKAANETPVKLLLPLVLLIFPTIFIILFGPILLSFLGNGF